MLRYICGDLTQSASQFFDAQQVRVNAETSRELQYALASSLFSSKTNRSWQDVREKLNTVAPPGEACFYCERDRYRDIDHVKPKRHYPELAFCWDNFVYACTICNQDAKKDTYGILDLKGKCHTFDRSLDWKLPVPLGASLLIDIRSENPFDFLRLDLNTGRYVEIGNALYRKKGRFTRDLFNLNDSTLAKIRIQAYNSFTDYLTKFQTAFAEGNIPNAERLLEEIADLPHPTVLAEMKRQSSKIGIGWLFNFIPSPLGDAVRSF